MRRETICKSFAHAENWENPGEILYIILSIGAKKTEISYCENFSELFLC